MIKRMCPVKIVSVLKGEKYIKSKSTVTTELLILIIPPPI